MFKLKAPSLKSKTFFAFVFIFALSFIPRFIMLFTQRIVSFEAEQGMDLLITKGILLKSVFPLTSLNNILLFHSLPRIPGWYYLSYIPFFLGNGNPFWAKAMTGVISIVTIVFIFFVTKSAFNLKTAIATSILLSISPWLIEQTGQYWPPYIIILPVAIYFWAIMKLFEKKQNYAILVALSIGLMVSFEVVTAIFCLAQTLLIVPLAIKYKYLNLKVLVLCAFALFLTLLPNVLYDLTHKFYFAGGFSALTSEFNGNISFNIIKMLGQRVDVFTWNFRSTLSPDLIKSICLFIIMYTGTLLFVKDNKNAYSKKLFVVYLALIPFITFSISFFNPSTIQAWYLLDLTVLYCFLLGIILGYFLEKTKLKLLSIAILLALTIIASIKMYAVFKSEFVLSFGVNRIAQAAPVDFIFNNANKQAFNYIPLDTSLHRYDFDYLFWWYGAKKYGYQPSVSKQKLTYYILDKNDANHESLPKKLTGKIITIKNFQTGYSVIKVAN